MFQNLSRLKWIGLAVRSLGTASKATYQNVFTRPVRKMCESVRKLEFPKFPTAKASKDYGVLRVRSPMVHRVLAVIAVVCLAGAHITNFKRINHWEDFERYMVLWLCPAIGQLFGIWVSRYYWFFSPSAFSISLFFSTFYLYDLVMTESKEYISSRSFWTSLPLKLGFTFGYCFSFIAMRSLGFHTLYHHLKFLHIGLHFIGLTFYHSRIPLEDFDAAFDRTTLFTFLAGATYALHKYPISVFSLTFPLLLLHYAIFPLTFVNSFKKSYRSKYNKNDFGLHIFHRFQSICFMFGSILGLPAQILYLITDWIFPKRLPYNFYIYKRPENFHSLFVDVDEDKEYALWQYKDQLPPRDI